MTLGKEVTELPDSLFKNCLSLIGVTFEGNITSIGISTFDGCRSLTSFTIPDTVTAIGDTAFGHCVSLAKITVTGNDAWITAIANGSNIGSDIGCFANGYTEYGNSIYFEFADAVTKEATLLESDGFGLSEDEYNTSGIDYYNGSGTTGEATWTLENNILTITGNGDMGDAKWISEKYNYGYSITSVSVGKGVTGISMGAFQNTRVQSVTLPDTITSIGDGAFVDCVLLKSITIPESVTSIGQAAFSGCVSLTSVDIPKNVSTVGVAAFVNCFTLADLSLSEGMNNLENRPSPTVTVWRASISPTA